MIFKKEAPIKELSHLIENYWLIDSEGDKTVIKQKIIPDGFPEIILHYGDPYSIYINSLWEAQPQNLLAGQFKNHFFLKNTGRSGMLGIKFKPAALTHLFDVNMAELTDRVINLPEEIQGILHPLKLSSQINNTALFEMLDEIFLKLVLKKDGLNSQVDDAIKVLLANKGMVAISKLALVANCTERQLERLFKKYIGISPKFYSRIIRFSHIFELMQSRDNSWSDLVYKSGFYDQSHFIKNFKEFTGEDPSAYGFDEKNMANFHLNKD